MVLFLPYLFLALVVFVMNIVPAFMPPTWIVLAFFSIKYHLLLLPVVLIGATCATGGRVILGLTAEYYIRPFFSQKAQKKFSVLGGYMNTKMRITIPLIIIYAFFPIPSNHVYIAAGLAKIQMKILALSFFIGRLVSYTVWVRVADLAIDHLETIFHSQFAKIDTLLIELIGFFLIYLLSQVDWQKRVFKKI